VVLIPLGVLLVDRIISRPVKTLMDGVQTLQNGDQWALTEFRAGDELGELAQAFGGMAATIAEREGQLKKARESLEEKVVQRTAELRHEIVVRAKAEEDLREALDLNEKITDKSPFGIIVFDENGVMVTVNEAAANIAGATINDLVGLRFYDLSSWRESGLASFADRALKSGMPQRADNVHAITKFGREVYLDAHFVPFRSGGHNRLLYVVNDVSEIRRAERALRQGEQRFRDFAEAASQWLWETDENHQFTEIIGAGPELLGIGRENILGRARWDIVSASDIARDPEGWRRNQEDMEHHRQFRNFEYTLTSPNGRLMHLNVSGKAVFSDDGEFQGYRGTGHDVTQRREIELQLIQASKMATLGEMATGVAHELNQPLNVIRMAASNVKRKIGKGDVDPTYVADKLDKINHNVGRAAAIIDHMRIFGRREVALEDVDPGSIIDETLGMIGQQLHLAGIEVTTELVENCPTIRMSPIQLEQVMLNLLSNARDALLDRAVTNKRINIAINVCMGEQCDNLACRQFEHPGNAIVITVRDNAGGISDAIKGRIFEPFFTTKETGKGTGLGLSISYGIIRELGGDLRVDNVEEGAVFAVLLPLRPGCDDVEVEGSGQLEHV
ncbi:MAG TPA: PAS domain S-box protein, partial [Magnetovibrio sp.]